MEIIDLGSCPADENCVQVVHEGTYQSDMNAQASMYLNMLENRFPGKPEGCRFFIQRNPHDYGTYMDVGIKYDETIAACIEYAFFVEENLPFQWNDNDILNWKKWKLILS